MVAKISRDSRTIAAECERQSELRHYPSSLFASVSSLSPVSVGGWYASATNHVRGAKTLRDWLTKSAATSGAIEDVLDSLFFNDGLSSAYRVDCGNDPRSSHVGLHSVLTPSRRERALSAVEELNALPLFKPAGSFTEHLVRVFISDVASQEVDDKLSADAIPPVHSHGDLHAENVLVDWRVRPWLVDYGDIDVLPWPSDIARLAVDLLVAGTDEGQLTRQWGGPVLWMMIAKELATGQRTDIELDSSTLAGRLSAIRWLRKNAYAIHGIRVSRVAERQLRLGIAVEFLRATYRVEEVSTRFRALALSAADMTIRSVGYNKARPPSS